MGKGLFPRNTVLGYVWYLQSNRLLCVSGLGWETLKLSFRRCADRFGMARWYQLIETNKQFHLSEYPYTPIWMLEANGVYSVKSFYKAINFGGVVSTTGEKLWKVMCPRNIHVFLWLCAYNITGDNVARRRTVDDLTWLFCNEIGICSTPFLWLHGYEICVETSCWGFPSQSNYLLGWCFCFVAVP